MLTVDERSFRNAKSSAPLLVGYKAFADLAGKAVMFVITVAAARRLAPAAFGVFSLASTLGWMIAVASDFGIQLHVARAVARQPRHAAGILRAWLHVRLWTAAAAVGLVMLALIAAQARVDVAMPILLFALVYGCSALVEFLHYFYRGLSRSDLESSLTIGQRAATLAFGLAVLLWRPDVSLLALAMLVPMAATLAVSIRIAMRLGAPHESIDGVEIAMPPPNIVSELRADVLPIGAGIVLSALYFRIDVFLVEWWRGTEAVALYNAVFRVIEALRLFPAALLAVALPSLCRARDLRPLAAVSIRAMAFAVVVTAALWITAGTAIPLLYGPAYTAAVPAFRVLALSFPLLSLNYALTLQLIAWNGQRAYAALCAGALAVNVALNAVLIPSASIVGAAWATLGTEVFLTLGCAAALAFRDAAQADSVVVGIPA